jgi:hypothetical protein
VPAVEASVSADVSGEAVRPSLTSAGAVEPALTVREVVMAVYDPIAREASTPSAAPVGGTQPPAEVQAPQESGNAVVAAERRYYWTALGLVVVGVIVGCALMYGFHPDPAVVPQLAPGVGVFAVLYVLAQVIERFLEPFSPVLGCLLNGRGEKKSKKTLVVARNKALVEARQTGNVGKKKECADKQDALNQFRANATPMAFGIAALLAMAGAGYTGFLVMHVIGLTQVAAPVDLLITGMAVGGGAKPLHDLITNLRESKTSKQDPPELQTS